jgi:hypothetical protein
VVRRCVRSRILKNEEAMARVGLQRHKIKPQFSMLLRYTNNLYLQVILCYASRPKCMLPAEICALFWILIKI